MGSYVAYETQFLKLWTEWEVALNEGERAPNFLKKVKFLAGLIPILQVKVKGKFPNTFEDALYLAREKDRKLQFQSSVLRMEQPQVPNAMTMQPYLVPMVLMKDPHMELLQRLTNQLDNLSINLVQEA